MLLVDSQLRELLPTIATDWEPDLIGPASLDVRLGTSFRKVHWPSVYTDSKGQVYDPKSNLSGIRKNMFDWREYNTEYIDLAPGEFVLGSTVEGLNLPGNIHAEIVGKSTIGRSGLIIEVAGFADPGFEGQLTLEIKNLLNCTYRLWAGQVIGQIKFWHTDLQVEKPYSKENNNYQGQRGATAPVYTPKIFQWCDSVVEEARKERNVSAGIQ